MNPVKSLQQALQLSEQILSAIDLQQLDNISRLDEERRNMIDAYYQNSETIDEKLTLELKHKNDEIVSRLVEMKQLTRTQQIKLNQAQKVSNAYLANTNKGST